MNHKKIRTMAGLFLLVFLISGAGAGNTITVSGFIAPPPVPSAGFTADAQQGTAPLQVRFTDMSSGSTTEWAWDFENDGIIDSTRQNPRHTYPFPGIYSVRLTVSNADGSDTLVKTDYILVNGKDPARSVQDLRDKVNSLLVAWWTKDVLDFPLERADADIRKSDKPGAKRSMLSFVDTVKFFGRFGMIDWPTANDLSNDAQEIIAIL